MHHIIVVASEARDLLSDAVHFHCLSTHTHNIVVASEARDLLSDAVHFHCLGTHTQVPSFDMYLIPEKGGPGGAGQGFLSPISSQTAKNIKKNKNTV